MKRWVFAGGEVGGARALMPVLAAATAGGVPFSVVPFGVLGEEGERRGWPLERSHREPLRVWGDDGVAGLVFSTPSREDPVPLRWARSARRVGLPVVFLLDNWMNYRRRLEMDGLPALIPDRYAVMDALAREEAVVDGIPPEVIRVTGHPALAPLARERARGGGERGLVVFLSEPVSQDQGEGPENSAFRGYTQEGVFRRLGALLRRTGKPWRLVVQPHPREDRGHWPDLFRSVWPGEGGVGLFPGGREAVWAARGVVGMASLLLHEAWLLGKPVLSLQPGLRNPQFGGVLRRKEIFGVTDTKEGSAAEMAWLRALERESPVPRPELEEHAGAPDRVLAIMRELTEGIA